MLLWAVPVGMAGALAIQCFRYALAALEALVLGRSGSLVAAAQQLPPWLRVLIPTVGGLCAGLLLVWAARRSRHDANTSNDYMEAIVLGDGRIPVQTSLLRSSASMVSIASGGSLGREGSMAQLAALSASVLDRWWRLPVGQLRLLVACGAAAGITAAYSAPVAGVFFVAEVVLGSLAMESLGPIIMSAAVANLTMRALPDYHPLYLMPPFPTVDGWEVLLFAPLGLLAGLAAAWFLRGLATSRAWFQRLPVPLPLRLALGGLIVGLLSLQWPEMWGNGYSVVNSVLHSPWSMALLLTLLAVKALATFATVGSGAVGGIFTPSLFFGCLMGAVFGQAVHLLWPHASAMPFAYAMVGMGAFLAGATQAPLMAMWMLFEMTQSYEVMLPLMVACVLAFVTARLANVGSMYDVTWRRLARRDEQQQLQSLQMQHLLQPALTVVLPDAGLQSIRESFARFPVKYLYVTNALGHYLGVVPLHKIIAMQDVEALPGICAADLLNQEIVPLTEDMSLTEALQRFLDHPGERLPVVSHASPPELLGVVSKSSLLTTYAQLSA